MTRSSKLVSILVILATPWLSHASSLPDAAEAKNFAKVRELISAGADLNAPQADGMTALHWACQHDDTGSALALLKAGANPSPQTRYGIEPINIAVGNGNAVLVKKLIELGADPNKTVHRDETLLMTAARVGKLESVKALVSAGADIDAKQRHGQTALMWAAHEGHLEVVAFLVDAGADYSTALESGYTPYFFAARQGHAEIVHYFIDRGIDVNAVMNITERNNRYAANGSSALILAMENGHLELAIELLQRGADANDHRTGRTPLHTLVRVRKPDRGEGVAGTPPPDITGDLDTLELATALVEHGADVNFQLKTGRKANGARISMIGCTPFFLACDTADIDYMEFLVKFGADPSISNENGTTSLMVAAGIGSHAPEEEAGTPDECLVAVQFLVELGADINAVNNRGETAMHGAAYKNAPQVAQYLDTKGADIQIWNTKNGAGRTPLFIAEGYRPGNFKPDFATIDAITALMLKHGATIPKERPVHVNYAP